MAEQITWGKDQRTYAKKHGLCLFGVGIDGREIKGGFNTGRYTQTGGMSEENARILFFAAGKIYDGSDPLKAMKEAIADQQHYAKEVAEKKEMRRRKDK